MRFTATALSVAFFLMPFYAKAAAPNPILDFTAIDPSVSPCTDFYQYACGNWIQRTEIPSDESRWARSFSVINQKGLETLRGILASYASGKREPKVPYAGKLGSFYASCMNERGVEAQTFSALAELKEVDRLESKEGLPTLLAALHLKGVSAFFGFWSGADLREPTLEIAQIGQGGMGLPNSTYYTKTDERSVKVRAAYVAHATRLLKLAGYSEAEAASAAASVLAVETRLAQNALPPEEAQDPAKMYFPTEFAGLARQAPAFNWSAYVGALGIKAPQLTNVSEPKYLAGLSALLQETDLASLRTYLKWRVLSELAPSIGKSFFLENFDFYHRTLNGEKDPSPRWKTCVNAVSGGMSEAVGQAFVAVSFSPQAKARVLELIGHLREAFAQDLRTLDWLDAPTREAALAKLQLLSQKIGYPDRWRNYDSLKVSRSAYWRNNQEANRYEVRRDLNKIGGKVDPTEWHMSPQTVNAYYSPSTNSINFPAAILQPPFFSEEASDAANYGAIGMVIGHEMTHGFDTSGSQFDGHGAQKDWWTPAVKKLFQEKAACLVSQYDQYEPIPGVKVNGKLTITENIADEGGLRLAHMAYALSRAGKPPEAPLQGFTADQQFYLAMAQSWCTKQTDEALRKMVLGNPHSPAKYRVIGPFVDSPDFQAAYACPAGSPMAPVNRCSLW